MPLPSNTRLGRYEILSQLGAGGMGEVYRARDPKINREVAIKVLPVAFSADEERLRRFEQEAQAAGALNHPNILAIHDVAAHDGYPYVVSELLEGQTLHELMGGSALQPRKAVDYALQIARGLAAAHERGIVHRDLKPENLFVTTDGRVKILDFGIAKLIERVGDGEAWTEPPTRRLETDPGMAIGTPGYMSPEQVRGQRVDHRSDLFSFGAVLYEMLAGRRAFRGDTAVETLHAILKEDPPDLSTPSSPVSPALARVVTHCLEKNPEQRFQSARDLTFALEAPSGSIASGQSPVGRRSRGDSTLRSPLPWAVAGTALLLAAMASAVVYRQSVGRAQTELHAVRLSILAPEGAVIDSMALSHDGRYLAFTAPDDSGRRRLWVRPMDSLAANLLSGTDGAFLPFWSPDGQFIAFFAEGKLKKIAAAGGPPLTLYDAPTGRGGSWGRDGTIIFTPTDASGLVALSASGEATPVTTLDETRQENSHRLPQFLPDGRHFIYLRRSRQQEDSAIAVGSLDEKGGTKILLKGALSAAAYAPPGYLIFAREQTLVARPFDRAKREFSGEAFSIAEHVGLVKTQARSLFSVSGTGLLAYGSTFALTNELLWFDRTGTRVGAVGPTSHYGQIALSPDGTRAAVTRRGASQAGDLWLLDVATGTPARFTFTPWTEDGPIWSPDGIQIVFSQETDNGPADLYRKPSSGAGDEERLLKTDTGERPVAWSPDGRFILYKAFTSKTRWDLWTLPVSGDRQPTPFLSTEADESQGDFSPDGRWVAYTSDETGSSEVYVQRFPPSGGKWQVSSSGGAQPKWRHDGKELFYLAPDRTLMSLEVKAGAGFQHGVPRPLFRTSIGNYLNDNRYAVVEQGQRFLISTAGEDETSAPISILMNWRSLKK